MLNLKFKNYPGGNWESWNPRGELSSLGTIKRGVESTNPGEAGLIRYDKVSAKFYYTPGTLAYSKFSGSLDAVERYLFEVYGKKEDDTDVKVFEGVCDFNSISEPENGRLISFNIIDKLSSLDILENDAYRSVETRTWQTAVGDPTYYIKVVCVEVNGEKHLRFIDVFSDFDEQSQQWEEYPQPIASRYLVPGNIVKLPVGVSDSEYEAGVDKFRNILITQSQIITVPYHALDCKIISDEIEPGQTLLISNDDIDTITYYSRNFGGIDIGNYTGSGSSEELVSYEASSILEAIVVAAWPSTPVYKQGFTNLTLPLSYYSQLIQYSPFGKHPYNALKYLADSMRCYVFFNRSGELILQKRNQLATGGTLRSFVGKKKISGTKKRFWDKLCDGVKITAVSTLKDDTGDYITAEVTVTKNPNIEPKNLISKEIFVTDTEVTTEAELITYATNIANEYFAFYGKRHAAYNLSCDLDDDILTWELLDRVSIDSIEYFIESMDINLDARRVTFNLVSVAGYDYKYSSAHVYQSENNKIAQTAAATITVNAATYGIDTYRWDGGSAGLDPVLARQSIGIDVTEPLTYDINTGLIGLAYSDKFTVNESGELDLIAGVYTFNAPLTEINSVVDLLFNTDNLALEAGTHLNTIQDIHTLASPQFAGLGLGVNADANYVLKAEGDSQFTGAFDVIGDSQFTGEVAVDGDIIHQGTHRLGSENYVSQLIGWNIQSPEGLGDFRYIYVDELRAKAFTADITQLLFGSDKLTKSGARLYSDFTIPAAVDSTGKFVVEDLEGFNGIRVFQDNDWVHFRVFDRSGGGLIIGSAWGTVVLDTTYGSSGFDSVTNTQRYTLTVKSLGYAGIGGLKVHKGTWIEDLGQSGDGYIERTVVDQAGSPYEQIVTWVTNPYNPSNLTVLQRLGVLTGISDPDFGGALTGHGFYLNENANIYIKGNYFVKSGAAIPLQDQSIMIGNITGTAQNAIKLSITDSTSTSGFFLYDSAETELLKFAVDGTRHIANWNFDEEKFYKVSGVNKFALNISSTAFIGANEQGFELYDISSPKIFVGSKNATGAPLRGIDYNITSAGEFTMRGVFSTRSNIDDDDGIYINGWSFNNRQFSDTFGFDWNLWLYPYAMDIWADGVTVFRAGDINGLLTYGIKTNGSFTFDIKDEIVPYQSYLNPIGTYNKKFLSLHVAEIIAETLVAQEVAASIGGRVIVPPASNVLIRDCHVGDTFIEVKYNNLKNGDIIYFEGLGVSGTQVEFMQVTSEVYLINGKYRYNVTRNLDNTSENGWWAGDSCISTGIPGDGFIDIYSTRGIKNSSQSGPTIVGNVRTSSTYNGWVEHWAIGNLSNLYGFGADVYGAGFGRFATGYNNITITDADGIVFKNYTDVVAQWSGDSITLGKAASHSVYITPSLMTMRYGAIEYITMALDSGLPYIMVGFEGDNNVLVDANGLYIRQGTTNFIELHSDGTGYFHGNIVSDATITGGVIRTSESPNNRIVLENNQLNFYVGATSKVSLYPYHDATYSKNTLYIDDALKVGSIWMWYGQIGYDHPSQDDYWLLSYNGFSAYQEGTFNITTNLRNDAFKALMGVTSLSALIEFKDEVTGNYVQMYYSDPQTTTNEIALKSSKMFDCNYGYKITGTIIVDGSRNAFFNSVDILSTENLMGRFQQSTVDSTNHSTTDWNNYAKVSLINNATVAGAGVQIVLGTDSAMAGIVGYRAGSNQQDLVFWTENTTRSEVFRITHDKKLKHLSNTIVDENGNIQTFGTFKSSDGSSGIETTFTDGAGNTLTVKDGIITLKQLAA